MFDISIDLINPFKTKLSNFPTTSLSSTKLIISRESIAYVKYLIRAIYSNINIKD